MIDKETKEAVPVTAFLHADQLAKDLQRVNDAARGRKLSVLGMALALAKQLRPVQVADALQDDRPDEEVRQDVRRDQEGRRPAATAASAATARSRTRRSAAATAGTSCSSPACGSRICSTTTSAAPSAASFRMRRRKGRSRFCAYNTGIGWRNIIEKMHMTATLTKWYEEHGRHQIYAGGKNGRSARRPTHNLVLDAEAVATGKQKDLDELGIAKNAREEKLRARKQKAGTAVTPRTSGWPRSTGSTS